MRMFDVFRVGLRTPLGLDLRDDGEYFHVTRVVPRGQVAQFNTLQERGVPWQRPHGGRTIRAGAMIELVEWQGNVLSGARCMRSMLDVPDLCATITLRVSRAAIVSVALDSIQECEGHKRVEGEAGEGGVLHPIKEHLKLSDGVPVKR